MDIRDWKESAVEWFKTGYATDEQWEEMAEALLDRSENEGLKHNLDSDIFSNAI